MQKYIDKMIADMELRGLSQMTCEGYKWRVGVFLRDTGRHPSDITLDDFRKYVLYLKDVKKISFGSINAYISSFKFFFCITLRKVWDEVKVPRMRGYRSLPVVLSKEEVIEIIDSLTNLKHKAILLTIYGSGLRVSEVAKLKTDDIDSRNMQILIRKSKNKSDRYAILSPKTLEILRKYWLECGRPKDWLFPGINEGEHISPKAIKNLILKIKEKLGITKKISAHTLRHCFATHLLENNVQLVHIQHLMGHNSLRTTTRYLHMTSKAMMNVKSPLDYDEGT